MNILVIVDDPETPHGRRMAECAELLGQSNVTWIVPTDDLATKLDELEDVDAVAIPFSIQGDPGDGGMIETISAAIERLMLRKVPVFVAAGNRCRNPLASSGIAIDSNFSIDGIPTPVKVGTSGRAVLAAAQAVRRKD